ncbi:MAG: peptidoglycan bridge formation glycyltransferase FemA/FemB family protein [bacterium]
MEIMESKDNFLQSDRWANFQEELGRKVWRFAGEAIVIKYPLPFGLGYLYCPRGPIKVNKELIDRLKDLAKKENIIFLRIEPPAEIDLKKFGFVETAPVQPKNTLILDLQKSEEELLNGFHQKTRYNIRLAEKKGVKVKIINDIEIFCELMKQTVARDNFSSHPKNYYLKLVESKLAKMFVAEFGGQIMAANLMVFFGDTATYLHGASADEGRNLMAPHLLQWAAIKEAKKQGYKYYDFWGVAPAASPASRDKQAGRPVNQPNHPWAGVTRFKEGFGGERVNYVGAWDLPVKKIWYIIYRMIKKLKM